MRFPDTLKTWINKLQNSLSCSTAKGLSYLIRFSGMITGMVAITSKLKKESIKSGKNGSKKLKQRSRNCLSRAEKGKRKKK